MDPRETLSNGRVAHISLKGTVEAERFVEGEQRQVVTASLPILDRPGGERARELLAGETFRVLDRIGQSAFGFAERDGYTGYVNRMSLGPTVRATHYVAAAMTYAKNSPHLKADTGHEVLLPFGARLTVVGEESFWARVAWFERDDCWVPSRHLRPIGEPFTDPATVAELFLAAPYLWGGNTSFGIDCSGLVQAALLACGIPCPGDSDQQAHRVGASLPPGTPLRRNDLVFWQGHVAIALDEIRIIHANAHHMAVAAELFEAARARIAGAGGGEVTSVRRP